LKRAEETQIKSRLPYLRSGFDKLTRTDVPIGAALVCTPPMFDSRIIFLDLETTGASADRDRITEVGLIEVADGELVSEWSTLVDPGREIPPAIVSLTGITDQMVADAPSFAQIGAALLERLEGRVLVAHNARFDYAFLRAEFRRIGICFRARVLCTVLHHSALRAFLRSSPPSVGRRTGRMGVRSGARARRRARAPG
jgi:DNA polymerase III epsilon subunit-like protein